MEAIVYIFIAIVAIVGIGWWLSVIGGLAIATKQDAAQGKITWVHGAIWTFFGTCLLIGLLRSCQGQ